MWFVGFVFFERVMAARGGYPRALASEESEKITKPLNQRYGGFA